MTSVDPRAVQADDDHGEGGGPPPASGPRRRRRPAPRAHPFFRFVFPALVVLAGVFVFVEWRAGTRAVLDSTEGRGVDLVTDPAEPGYLAYVAPTPTMLVVHTDTDGSLVGATVLAQTALEDGGSAVLLTGDLVLSVDGDDRLLSEVYRDDGVEALEQAVADLFGFGFTDDPVVIDPEGLRQWLRLVEPIPYNLLDDLTELDGDGVERVVIEAGGREFDGETLARIYGWRNPGEFDDQRLLRQKAVWEAWLGRIGAADDLVAVTLVFPLSPFLQSLGAGADDVELAPLEPVSFDDGASALYVLPDDQAGWWDERAAEMVPLPIGARPGQRPTVRLLDGVGDPALRDAVLPEVVAAGGEVAVIGNASTFEVTRSTVDYHVADDQAAAEALGAALGLPVVFDESPDQPVDLTVTIGADMEAE